MTPDHPQQETTIPADHPISAIEPLGSVKAAPTTSSDMSRRALLTAVGGGALGVATAALTVATPSPAHAHPDAPAAAAAHATVVTERNRKRVIIIGGGISGVSMAWLLDGEHDVTLLEAEEQLGGHIHTVDVDVDGTSIPVDLGAQFFAAPTHPLYTKLVDDVLRLPTVKTPLDLTLFHYGEEDKPTIVSPHNGRLAPLAHPRRYWPALAGMQAYTHAARKLQKSGNKDVTVEEFVESLHVPSAMKLDLMYPLTTMEFGCPITMAKSLSAWAATIFVAQTSPTDWKNPLEAFAFSNVKAGIASVLEAMSSQFTTVGVHTGARVTDIAKQGNEYKVRTPRGEFLADHVIMAIPGYAMNPLLSQLHAKKLHSASKRLGYFTNRVAIHTDPTYMPADKGDWSAYNHRVDRGVCEGTIWFGAFRKEKPYRKIFKSWITHRRELPKEIVIAQDFKHPVLVPDFFRAGQELAQHTSDGLWFAGGHTVNLVSQDSGVEASIRVAQQLAPQSANLARLVNA